MAVGEFVFHAFGAIAHFKRRLISERTKDGISAARLKGNNPGRPVLSQDTLKSARELVKSGLSVFYPFCDTIHKKIRMCGLLKMTL